MAFKLSCLLGDVMAKVVRYRTDNNSKGVQATVTLPSAKEFQRVGYTNFYLGFGNWEVGISTKSKSDGANPNEKWHWFVNSTHGEMNFTEPWIYNDGDTVFLKAFYNSSGKMEFHVNDVKVFESTATELGTVNNARFVVASEQNEKTKTWGIYHNQVTIKNLMYRDGNNAWLPMRASNSYVDHFNCPTGDDSPSITFTEPSASGAYAYCSLKK